MRLLRKKPHKTQGRQPNLTLAGDRQPTRTGYYSRRSEIDESNTGRQQSRSVTDPKPRGLINYWLQRFGLLVLIVVILASVISGLSLSSNAHIITLKSSGSTFLRDASNYQKVANGILASSILNKNKITIDTASFSKKMLKQFPELNAVSVVLPMLAHRPVVYLTATQPSLIITGVNGSFVLDNTGKTLRTIADANTIASYKLPVLLDQSGLKLLLGQKVLSSTDIDFILSVMAQLSAKQVAVSGLTLPVASREIDVSIAGQPYYAKFNLQNGKSLQQVGTLIATKVRLESQGITPSHYIDVRVPGRAYYL